MAEQENDRQQEEAGATMTPQATFTTETEPLHETRDVNVRLILLVGAAMIVAAVVIHLAIWGLLELFTAGPAPRQGPFSTLITEDDPLPPEPRLQVSPRLDMAALRERQEEILNSYGQVDEEVDIVRIPIDVAMDLLVERGLPARSQTLEDILEDEEPIIEEEGLQELEPEEP
ncbi:MAG TPA: hypothetical protein VF177_11125 [Anaerolineae bacterium]